MSRALARSSRAIDLLAAALALADADPGDLALHDLLDDADTRRVATRGTHDHDVRHRDGCGLVEAATGHDGRASHAGGVADRPRLRVSLGHVEVLDDHAALGRARLDDPAPLPAVLAGEHLDGVALLDLHGGGHRF